MQQNDLKIKLFKVKDLEFILTAFSIGDEKHIDLKSVKFIREGDEVWDMCIKADREGDGNVANWFKEHVSPGRTIACDSYDEWPEKLNFAIMGNLEITLLDEKNTKIQIRNVVIAQGHNARLRNNWWLGGPEFENPDKKTRWKELNRLDAIVCSGYYLDNEATNSGIMEGKFVFCPVKETVNEFSVFYVK